MGLIIRTLHFRPRENLMRGWIYRNVIFSFPTIFGGGDYIVTLYFHPWQYLVRGRLYHDIIFSLTIFGEGVNISYHYIFTPDNIWRGGDYIVTLYSHPWQYLVRGWLYRDIIFSLLAIFGQEVIISWHYIFTLLNLWRGVDYILTYFHSWQYLVGGWKYRDIIFSLLTIFGAGVIISWHYILTSDNIWSGGDYIVTLYFHSSQYLVRGWLYPDIFSLLTIFSEGVNISWHYIFTPDNILWGDDYIMTLYFHSWQFLVRGWIYRTIIFSLLTIFGAGVIISWHYILTPDNIWLGVIISWHYIFTPLNIWWGGDSILTYFHSWQYLVRGWKYNDIIFSFLTIFGAGWLYREIIFSPLTIFGQGVIISWHYIFTPGNISWGGDYIVTYFHSWQYLVRGWIYRDIIFSLLIIFGEGVIISWHYISLLAIFGEGVIILWHYIFTPGNIWWGGDYIVTHFHSWRYLVRGWLYRDITISFLTLL